MMLTTKQNDQWLFMTSLINSNNKANNQYLVISILINL